MAIRFVLLFITSIGLVFFALTFIRKKKIIQLRWKDGLRHIVAVIVGWGVFTVLYSTFMLLDLLEKGKYSLEGLVDALQFPMVLFIGGMILLVSSLGASVK